MIIEVDKNASVVPFGDLEISIPDHMVMLPQEELDEVMSLHPKDRSNKIIAAGKRKGTVQVEFVTGDGAIYSLDQGDLGILADGEAFPDDFGQTLSIEVGEDEENDNVFEFAAEFAIENSELLM